MWRKVSVAPLSQIEIHSLKEFFVTFWFCGGHFEFEIRLRSADARFVRHPNINVAAPAKTVFSYILFAVLAIELLIACQGIDFYDL